MSFREKWNGFNNWKTSCSQHWKNESTGLSPTKQLCRFASKGQPFYVSMIAKDDAEILNLIKGQIWKLENGFIQICHHGKRLVEYKTLIKPEQKRVRSSLIRPDELVDYLRKKNAQLMN